MALITLAKAKGWKAHLLDYRNSGDTAGDKSRVVGYASIVFVDEAHKDQAQSAAEVQKKHEEGAGEYDAELRQQILSLARKSLIETVEYGRKLKVAAKDFPGPLSEPKGCFVTLTIKGALRGCIGHILPHEPLYQAVIDNARSAAINDTRFPALTLEELENVHIEVSVLTKPKALQFDGPKDLLAKLRPNIDGVVLHIGGRMATFLPQVWEQLPDKV
jgi:AmmeMemoRadiSam system protein A